MAEKIYICECGKTFNNSQSFNGHKAHCEQHQISKYGNLEILQEHNRKCTLHNKITNAASHAKALSKKQNDLLQWISEHHTCEYCGKVMTEKYSSGRFCSSKCAHSRKHTEQTKQKISDTAINKNLAYLEEYNNSPKYCMICGKVLSYNQRNNKVCSRECVNEYNSIYHPNHFKKIIYGKNIPGRHIVYKVINDFDDRYYIGVRKTDDDSTDYYLGSGIIIKRMVKKYGKEHFKRITLFEYDCSEDAFNKEKELLQEALQDKNCVNIAAGGQGGKTH